MPIMSARARLREKLSCEVQGGHAFACDMQRRLLPDEGREAGGLASRLLGACVPQEGRKVLRLLLTPHSSLACSSCTPEYAKISEKLYGMRDPCIP